MLLLVSSHIFCIKNYNQSFGDITPLTIANGLSVMLNINNVLPNKRYEVFHISPRDYPPINGSIEVHRRGDHFNGILTTQLQHSHSADNSLPVPETLEEEISEQNPFDSVAYKPTIAYNSDYLKSLNGNYTIKRSIRKKIFKLNLWYPRNYNVSESEMSHLSVQYMDYPVDTEVAGTYAQQINPYLLSYLAKQVTQLQMDILPRLGQICVIYL